jgi:tetratricopeptide (TPR) repeat protein
VEPIRNEPGPARGFARTLLRAALLLLPALAAVAAYADVASFGYVFDDQNALVEHEALHRGDWWHGAFGAYTSLANRPLACLTFAWELAAGRAAGDLHVVNLALHAGNAVLLGFVLRRLLATPNLRECVPASLAPSLATVVACVWAVHPLTVDAVAYLTQRSMLLLGLFTLLAAAALLQSHRAARPRTWQAATVAALALAMASKEEGAALPILFVLAERAFVFSSWREVWARWRFHAALFCAWSVLLLCVWLGPRNPTVGYATVPPATAIEWLLTQAPIVVHYLASALWPSDLRGVYDFAIVRNVASVVVPGLVVAALLAATALGWRRRPWLGFAGAWFFLLLAPTSSLFPIVTEPCADRRMYLPLVAVLVLLGAGAARLAVRIAPRAPRTALLGLGLLAAMLAGWRTREVAAGYRDDEAFWRRAATENELQNDSHLAGRILSEHGKRLFADGKPGAARIALERAMRCEAPGRAERLNHANLVAAEGRTDEAERLLRGILRDYPDYPAAMGNLANLLLPRGELDEAERLLARAVELGPRQPVLHNSLGIVRFQRGDAAGAVPHLRAALQLQPDYVEAARNLGTALLSAGDPAAAIAAWQPLLPTLPKDPLLRVQLAAAHDALGEVAAARTLVDEALQLDPGHPAARALQQRLERVR